MTMIVIKTKSSLEPIIQIILIQLVFKIHLKNIHNFIISRYYMPRTQKSATLRVQYKIKS